MQNVRAERSGAVMVLSMDIVGDGAADSDELSAGSNWQKPAFGEKYPDKVGEGDTALAAEDASGVIESEDAIQTAAIDERAIRVEARVAVTASQTVWKKRAVAGCL